VNLIAHAWSVLFNRFPALNQDERETDGQPPVGISIFACLVCFALVFGAARPADVLFSSWWVELLFYALLPVAVTFMILNRSCWHREITGMARICSLLLLSSVIFCGVLLTVGALLAAGCFFTLGLKSDMGP
jgi:hypothetical protein